MRQLVEQGKNLPGPGAAVVGVDDREFVVIQAKARIVGLTEGILEDEHTDVV